ncbi:pilin [Nocardiopsis composta]
MSLALTRHRTRHRAHRAEEGDARPASPAALSARSRTPGGRGGRGRAADTSKAAEEAGARRRPGRSGAGRSASARLGEAAWAQEAAEASTADIREVVERLRNVVVALASAVGTLLLAIAGLRWMLAGGDPSQIDAAKRALSGAGIGYGIAILATALMAVLDYVVSGSGG